MADDKGFWQGFKDGLQSDSSPQTQPGMPADSSHLIRGNGWQITTDTFLWKILLLAMTLFGGMLSGAYALFQEQEQLKFALGYALPSLIETVIGGLLGGGILWGISSLLFGTNTRGTARMLVLTSACIVALYCYLYQFSFFNNWSGAFSRQSHFALGTIAVGFFWSLPWTRMPR